MKTIKTIIVSFVAICALSCDQLGIGKKYFNDLEFREDRRNYYAYKDGKVFDGTAWSSDGKTIKIEVNNGLVISVVGYHPNGNIAMETKTNGSETYYDEDGRTLSKAEFKQRYPNMEAQFNAFEPELHFMDK